MHILATDRKKGYLETFTQKSSSTFYIASFS